MIYCVAGLYGKYNTLIKMLEEVNFSDDDELYLIGDVLDYHSDCLKIIELCMEKDNIHLLVGEHEQMMLKAIGNLIKNNFKIDNLPKECFDDLNNWICYGGDRTLASLYFLEEDEVEKIYHYINTRETYKEVNGYILTHGCLLDLKDMPSDIYTSLNDIGYCISLPNLIESNKSIVVGHIPTQAIVSNNKPNEIYQNRKVFNIYTDTLDSNILACLRLDDMEKFYIIDEDYKEDMVLDTSHNFINFKNLS